MNELKSKEIKNSDGTARPVRVDALVILKYDAIMVTKEKLEAYKTKWYKSLQPFAQDWIIMREKIRNRVKELSDKELKNLKQFLKQPTQTNCWFAIYEVAREQLPEIIRDELLDRNMIEE